MSEETTAQVIARLKRDCPWKTEKPATIKVVNRAFNPGKPPKEGGGKGSRAGIPKRKPVRCIETGQVFESATRASATIGLASNAVTLALLRKKKGIAKVARAAKLTWEYVDPDENRVA